MMHRLGCSLRLIAMTAVAVAACNGDDGARPGRRSALTLSDGGASDGQSPDGGGYSFAHHAVTGNCRLLWQVPGTAAQANTGHDLLTIADFNGDGKRDVVVTAERPGADLRTLLLVLSGRDGALLKTIEVPGAVYRMSSIADLDGDGTPEVAFGAFTPPASETDGGVIGSGGVGTAALVAMSLRAGHPVWQRPGPSDEPSFGMSVAAIADDDGDGTSDLLVGSPNPASSPDAGPSPGRAYILSGTDGHVLRALHVPPQAASTFGSIVLQTQDLNDDSHLDFFIADPFGPISQFGNGNVLAISGANDAVLWSTAGSSTASNPDVLGNAIITAGDLSSDGISDLVAGADNHFVPLPGAGGEATGQVRAFRGQSGAPLWSHDGRRDGEHLGLALATVGDLNQDGVPDIVAGAPSVGFPVVVVGQGGRFTVLSGKDGATLIDLESVVGDSDGSDLFGTSVAVMDDVSDDGHPDLLVGAPASKIGGTAEVGVVTAWSCLP